MNNKSNMYMFVYKETFHEQFSVNVIIRHILKKLFSINNRKIPLNIG